MELDTKKIEELIKRIKTTKNPAEFIGSCKSIQQFSHNSLNIVLKLGILEFLVDCFSNNELLKQFIIKDNVPRDNLIDRFHVICLDTISILLTSDYGTERFMNLMKNESLLNSVSSHVKSYYENKDSDYKKSACIFASNLTLYEKILIEQLELVHIIGDFKFSCLDEKDINIIGQRINGACNYYNVGISFTNIKNFFDEVVKRKNTLDKDVLRYIHNLIISLMTALNIKDKSFKKKLNILL
jgi:hypothetical protein